MEAHKRKMDIADSLIEQSYKPFGRKGFSLQVNVFVVLVSFHFR